MPYTTQTLAALRARLQRSYDSTPFWSDQEANDAINEALYFFNLYTGYWRGSATANTVASSPFVSVPGSLTYRARVTRAGKTLKRKSIVELYRQRRGWRTQTTASGGEVPTTIQEWAPIGLATIAIWPADAAGGTTLTFEAIRITPILTADGSLLDLGDEEIQILLDEALYVLAFKRPSILPTFRPRHLAFLAACVERNDQLRASSYFRQVLGLDQEQRLEPAKISATPDQEAPAAP